MACDVAPLQIPESVPLLTDSCGQWARSRNPGPPGRPGQVKTRFCPVCNRLPSGWERERERNEAALWTSVQWLLQSLIYILLAPGAGVFHSPAAPQAHEPRLVAGCLKASHFPPAQLPLSICRAPFVRPGWNRLIDSFNRTISDAHVGPKEGETLAVDHKRWNVQQALPANRDGSWHPDGPECTLSCPRCQIAVFFPPWWKLFSLSVN